MRVWKRIRQKINQKSRFDNEPQRSVVLLRCIYLTLLVYYIIFFLLMGAVSAASGKPFRISWLALISTFWTILLFWLTYHQRIRRNLILYVILELVWLTGFVYIFGWGCGAQQIMFVLLVLVYFSFYDALPQKAAFTVGLFLFRFALFYYTLNHDPYSALEGNLALILQVWSSMSFFTLMGVICGFYSSNIETADKTLILYNEQLQKMASADPLTGIWNRRSMLTFLHRQLEQNPDRSFSVGMGDIDLFKHVNDHYGHDCGDAVLKWLTERLQGRLQGVGQICRWGGEEFLVYFSDKNGDEAKGFLLDFILELSRTPFQWNGREISITMTFGVEEYDFHSGLDALIKKADEKLYIGKEGGRNQVVF
ncbi:MAG: GGDEF domain-containing protein [Lachnospiraceae bacterium]|nr:GGDEF domain-containing protein [Lachnospiraceae bacterium]